jgi:hypothetical protein
MATTGETLITSIDDISKATKTMKALLVNGSALGQETLGDIFYAMCPANATAHNAMPPRYKNITAYVTDGTLWKRLNGTDGYEAFEDIFPGDYITMTATVTAPGSTVTGTNRIDIVGLNEFRNNNNELRFNHLVCVPHSHFGNALMNSSNTTAGGYFGSSMFTDILGIPASSGSATGTINQQLYAIFGSHLKTYKELLSTAINPTGYNRFGTATGCSNAEDWKDVQSVLMSEIEVWGSIVWSSSGQDTGTANKQLSLFRHSRADIVPDEIYYCLKDVGSASVFACVYDQGFAYIRNASSSSYVRPRFILGA